MQHITDDAPHNFVPRRQQPRLSLYKPELQALKAYAAMNGFTVEAEASTLLIQALKAEAARLAAGR
jgi:hypothetical protein